MIELIRALEGGAAVARNPLRAIPLIERNPVRFWQVIALLLVIALVIAIVH